MIWPHKSFFGGGKKMPRASKNSLSFSDDETDESIPQKALLLLLLLMCVCVCVCVCVCKALPRYNTNQDVMAGRDD